MRFRPGSAAWSAAIWLIMLVDVPFLIATFISDNSTVKMIGLVLAVVGIAGVILDNRARRRSRGDGR